MGCQCLFIHSLQVQGLADTNQRDRKVGRRCECFPKLGDGIVIPAPPKQVLTIERLVECVERVQFQCSLDLRHRFVGTSHDVQEVRVIGPRLPMIGVELDGPLGSRPIPFTPRFQYRQTGMSFGEGLIQLQRFENSRLLEGRRLTGRRVNHLPASGPDAADTP